jgi:hypothetical protein
MIPFNADAIDTTPNSKTISLSLGVSELALYVSPDLGLFNAADTITVTLSDGTTASFSGNYPANSPRFVGFYGGSGITSITVSTLNAPDFGFGDFNPVAEPVCMTLVATALIGLHAAVAGKAVIVGSDRGLSPDAGRRGRGRSLRRP